MAHPKSALFNAENIPAVAYVRLLNSVLGKDWVTWEPETVRKSIADKFSLPDATKRDITHQPLDRAMATVFAAKTLISNPDVFSTRLEGFENIIIGLNNHVPDFDVIEISSPAELNYGVQIAKSLTDFPKFSEDVVAYIRACFAEHGVFAYPDALVDYEPDSQKDLRIKIRARSKTWVPGMPVSDDIITVQAAKLYDVENYARERLLMAKEELASAK